LTPVNAARLSRIGRSLAEIAWAAALITLPITSFAPFANTLGSTVAPLAALPIFLLLIGWLLPHLLRSAALPRETFLVFIFILAALLSSGAGFLLSSGDFEGQSILGRELRAFFTLGIGLAFYLLFAAWNNDTPRLQATWRWLSIGGMLALGWALLQAYFIVVEKRLYPPWLENLQDLFLLKIPHASSRGLRIDGLAYEPSWFAHQMVMLYLPLWLAATYLKTSAFKFRLWRFSIENLLLLPSVFVFFLAQPRVSMLSLLLILVFLFVKINLAIYRWLVRRILGTARFSRSGAQVATVRRLTAAATLLGMLTIYLATLVGAVYLASRLDWRVQLLLDYPPSLLEIWALLTLNETALLNFSFRLAFMERVVYWVTGWHIFQQYPWLGVGLGNAGFHFLENIPSIGYSSWEVRGLLYHLPYLPNIKSLWVRLLAETGVVGFSVFLTWFYLQIHSAWVSLRNLQPALKTLAMASLLGLIAFIAEGFSLDSFAMPYLWVCAGLASAVGMIYRRQWRQKLREEEDHEPTSG